MPPSRTVRTGGDGGAGRGLLAEFDDCLTRQDRLCDDLRDLADSLPWRLDTHRAVLVSRRLGPLLRRAHFLEETRIHPALMAGPRGIGPVLDRLSAEHVEDEEQAGDLADAIAAFLPRQTPQDAERLGYMLRCLFTGLRRHVAHDRDYLRPLLIEADKA